ncbi:MAG TPA: PH domain-containing protein [Acidimicrobiales bacterium]|nr:PH domain-containing protein [Acidimicrobiales bacterium]
MPFPRRLLTDDEDVIVELRPHWAFLGWPLVVAVAVVVLAIAVVASFPHAPVGVLYLLLVSVSVSALWLAGRLVRWFATNLVVTTSRIVQRSGVLSRNGLELRLERVNQLSYHQSIAARLFRSGELLVEMGGETGVIVFDHVPRPAAVQAVITEQIDAVHRRPGPTPAGTTRRTWDDAGPGSGDTPPSGTTRVAPVRGEASIADLLVELDELRRRGIVTDAEFATKKAELLDRL